MIEVGILLGFLATLFILASTPTMIDIRNSIHQEKYIEPVIKEVSPVIEPETITVKPDSLYFLRSFLEKDNTDENRIKGWKCHDYAKQLRTNASVNGIELGTILLSHNQDFQGLGKAHTRNYMRINDSIYLIEPQNDQIMLLEECEYEYFILYPEGNAPTQWIGKLEGKEIIFNS